MSGPPPPPPAAPPPPLPNFAPSKGGGGDHARSALLKSIEKGTRLKKTVTNDRSAPIVGKTVNNNNNSNTTSGSTGMNHNGPPVMNGFAGLGGLFADGMPKLRPTGKLGNMDNNSTAPRPVRPILNRQNSNTGPTKKVDNIQNQLKQQLANNDNRHRGPPPPAPSRNISDDSQTRINGTNQNQFVNNHRLLKNVSSLHQSKSNTNLSADQTDHTFNGVHNQLKQVISHGKPNLAPKPPITGTLPNKNKLKLAPHGQVLRSHSCRTPRSPSPSDSRSTENLPIGGNKMRVPSSRPMVPPPSVPPHLANNHSPGQMPKNVKPPNHAPPPPPNALPQVPQTAPPPPPHRTLRLPPAVPTHNPPPPPPRLSSMSRGPDLEELFKDKFRSPNEFPPPPIFQRCRKVYSNRQALNKQQAPQPPTLPTRNWNSTSAC